jgi:hypothetical protein
VPASSQLRTSRKWPLDVGLMHRYFSASRVNPQGPLGGSVDPFASAVIPMTPRMSELFHFYVTVQLPIGYALNREWQEAANMSTTLGSAALIYAIFAGCAGHLEAYSGGSAKSAIIKHGNNETKIPESLAYKMKSVALINKAFADPVERLSDAVYHSLKSICRAEVRAFICIARVHNSHAAGPQNGLHGRKKGYSERVSQSKLELASSLLSCVNIR